MQPRIMYIENKSAGLTGGEARIGLVKFSQTGKTLYYGGKSFESTKGAGCKANYRCVETREEYWISGPKRRGGDGLYGGDGAFVDADVREAYWTQIRNRPASVERARS